MANSLGTVWGRPFLFQYHNTPVHKARYRKGQLWMVMMNWNAVCQILRRQYTSIEVLDPRPAAETTSLSHLSDAVIASGNFCNILKPTTPQSSPLWTGTGQMSTAEKTRIWTSLWSSIFFFSFHTATSITFHVYNRPSRRECLHCYPHWSD